MGWLRRSFAVDDYVDLPTEQRSDPTFSVGDAALSEYLGLNGTSVAGVSVTQNSALGISAVYRSVSLIAGTVAGLPLKSYRKVGDRRERIATFLDSPDPDGATPYEWCETVVAHLLLAGNSFSFIVRNGAGAVVGLKPIVPSAVTVEPDDALGRIFKITDRKGQVREFTGVDVLHIPALSFDGLKGMSVVSVARQSFGTAIAGDQAAARMWSNGLLLGGILTAKDGQITAEQAEQVKAGFKARAQGVRNAGDVAFLPADLQFTPWSMSAEDAQFLESRHFQIEEVARWYGVPRELLSESGASSWGSGIQELIRAFSRFTLASWTTRIEQRLSSLLPKGSFAEFDYSGLLQPSPEQEIALLIQQVQAGLITVDEARGFRNMAPLPAVKNLTPAQDPAQPEPAVVE